MPTFNAVLTRTTADLVKSRILSPQSFQLVLDCYGSPDEFAAILNEFYEDEIIISLEGKV